MSGISYEADAFLIDVPPRLSGKGDVDALLAKMVEWGGSDLFLMSGSEVWMSLYGRKQRLTRRRLGYSEVMSILSEIYATNAQTQMGREGGRPLDFSYEYRPGRNERSRFRVNASGCVRDGTDAATITFRAIPTTPPLASDIGVEADILTTCNQTDQGMILVVGATGNGKSTLLAAILRQQMEEVEGHRNFVTIESPIEFVYDTIQKPSSFVTQIEVGRHVSSFSAGVVNSLRMAPNVILIGEARDFETVSASVEASKTGHTVYSTVHANNVPETLARLVAVYPQATQARAQYELVDSMKLIIAQRLIPSVDGKRVAIREYLVFDNKVKESLRRSTHLVQAAYEALSRWGRPMMADVQAKFEAGLISEATYLRQKDNYEASLEMSHG